MFYREEKLTAVSLFAGGGTLDYAFKDQFNIIWANELEPSGVACYRHNIGEHIVGGSILDIEVSSIPKADVIIGGPPCIDFSTGGANRGDKGIHGQLVWTYLRIVKEKEPKAFVFENVEGLVKQHKQTLNRLIETFEDIGYTVSHKILDAADFGTGQRRKRIFIVGIRNDLNFKFQFPELKPMQKDVSDVIRNLPEPCEIGTRDKHIGIFPNHVVTWTNPTPERIHYRTENPCPNQRTGMKRLEWNKVCHTITAHIAKDGREFLHPDEDRRITVREALRLMGVPDTFIFPEDVSLSHQYRIVGNGVAYPVAKYLSESLSDALYLQLHRKRIEAA